MHNFLYQDNPAPNAREKGNAGLWYNKFFNQWQFAATTVSIPEDGKEKWLATVANNRKIGDTHEVESYVARMVQLLEHHQQAPLFYKLESDFVTGLGLEHPVENGFAWHHSLGTPYLPGSSVKGLVRAWAEQWQANSVNDKDFARIFGSGRGKKHDNKEGESKAGSVIFLDALATRPVSLKADIITSHYGAYYQDASGNTAPADWLSPNPIPFLVVERGCTFVFGVLPRQATAKKARADCEEVEKWLAGALEWLGAGAKTAVGYGRFSFDATATKKHQQAAEEAKIAAEEAKKAKERERVVRMKRKSMSPIRLEMDKAGYDDKKFVGKINEWIARMHEANEAEKCEIALYLKEWYDKVFKGNMNDKNKDKLGKIEAALASCPDAS